MHLLGLSEWLAVGAVGDDVVGREALGLIQLGRFEHSKADVYDHVGRTLDHHGDQRQAILGRDRGCWLARAADVLGSVIADQERGYAQCAFLMLWGESERYGRAFTSASGRDGRRRLVSGWPMLAPNCRSKTRERERLMSAVSWLSNWEPLVLGGILIFVRSWANSDCTYGKG